MSILRYPQVDSAAITAEIAAAIEEVIGSPRTSFVYRPGGVRADNVYGTADWEELVANQAAVQGTKYIEFDHSIIGYTNPIVIPLPTVPGTPYSMDRAIWVVCLTKNAIGSEVQIPEGVTFTDLRYFSENIIVNFTGNNPPIQDIANNEVIVAEKGAKLRTTGTGALVENTAMANGEVFIMALFASASSSGAGGVPLVNLVVPGSAMFAIAIGGSTYDTEYVGGDATTVVLEAPRDTGSKFSTSLPSFLGTKLSDDNTIPRWQVNGPTTSGPVDLSSAGDCYTFDTTGGAFTVSLPFAAPAMIGESIWVKKVAGAAALTISPRAGDTIDGSAVGPDLTSTTGSLMFVRDTATNWIMLGGGV